MGLFIVSDGMGGAQAGEIAARLVTTILPKMIESRLRADAAPSGQRIRAWLQQDMLALSKKMYLESNGNPMAEGMGATVVAALVRGGRVFIAHMGDSRAYLFRQKRLLQLTNDHSVVSLLLRSREITEAQARVHPARGHLTRFVGMKDEVFGDVRSIQIKQGDRLLLCTDGLTGMISDTEIAQLLGLYTSTDEACKRLVEAANDAGGKDNVTALAVDISCCQDASCRA
jgi:protein phosphatase